MAEFVYALCALTSAGCAVLLIRAFRRTRVRLLLWAAISFALFFVQNGMLFLDLVVLTAVDLSLWRALIGACGAVALLYGVLTDVE